MLLMHTVHPRMSGAKLKCLADRTWSALSNQESPRRTSWAVAGVKHSSAAKQFLVLSRKISLPWSDMLSLHIVHRIAHVTNRLPIM